MPHALLPLALLPSLFLGSPAGQDPADLSGHWTGQIEQIGLEFDVDLALTEGALVGDISIPVQGLKDLDLAQLALTSGQLRFVMPDIPGEPTFEGAWDAEADRVAGTFTQGQLSLPFHMQLDPGPTELIDALAELRPQLEAMLADWKTPGLALGVVQGERTLLLEGYGTRDMHAASAPVDADTLFAIGSATKAFTTLAVAQLVEEGELDWDRPVVRDLPGFRLVDDSATLYLTPRDMASHRSGLPRHDLVWYGNGDQPLKTAVLALEFLEPSADLRERPQYNNLMIATLGHLVATVSEQPFEAFVETRILRPLGMDRTVLSVAEALAADNHALPHVVREDELVQVPHRVIRNVAPAGSIQSSARDMLAWLRLNLGHGPELVSSGTLRELHTPVTVFSGLPAEPEFTVTTYALGWMVDSYRGHLRIHHGGNIDGFSALVTFFPHADVGIVALANGGATPVPEFATRLVADHALELELRDWNGEALAQRDAAKTLTEEGEPEGKEEDDAKDEARRVAGTQPSHPLEELAGTYEHRAYGTLEVRVEGEGLAVTLRGMTCPLEHWHYNVFHGTDRGSDPALEDLVLHFTANVDGRIDALESPLEAAVDPIRFTRAPDQQLTDPAYLARFVGQYDLPGQRVTIELVGAELRATVPGQPTFTLVPEADDTFALKGLSGFGVRFEGEGDAIHAAVFLQPNGTFRAERHVPE